MAQTGPTAVLRDGSYTEVTVQDGVAIPAGQPYIPIAGQDGTNVQALRTDSTGRPVVAGAGTAGASAGGVLTVQGDPAGVPIPVTSTEVTAGTSTITRVASSATSVTILAANAARLGAVIINDSNRVLYLKFGATASTTSYTYKMAPDDRIEVPFGYDGVIDGIWNVANGAAQATELTP